MAAMAPVLAVAGGTGGFLAVVDGFVPRVGSFMLRTLLAGGEPGELSQLRSRFAELA
jgi:hypothetical protein